MSWIDPVFRIGVNPNIWITAVRKKAPAGAPAGALIPARTEAPALRRFARGLYQSNWNEIFATRASRISRGAR